VQYIAVYMSLCWRS